MLRAAGLLHVGCERCGSHAPVGAAQRVPDCSALKPFLRVGALAGVIALLSRDAHSPEVSSFGISNSRLLLLFAERWPQYKGISKSLRFNRSPPPTHPHQNHPHHTTTSRPYASCRHARKLAGWSVCEVAPCEKLSRPRRTLRLLQLPPALTAPRGAPRKRRACPPLRCARCPSAPTRRHCAATARNGLRVSSRCGPCGLSPRRIAPGGRRSARWARRRTAPATCIP